MSAAWSYECAVRAEILGIKLQLPPLDPYFRKIAENLQKLSGKNLACWCPKDMPDCYCHAGKLIEMANVRSIVADPLVRVHLPARLRSALEAVIAGEGDDLYFVLGYLAQSTARSYISQLKSRGLAYTHVSGGTVEVWAHDKGRRLVRPSDQLNDAGRKSL